jgi:hypothetical protein
VQLIEMSFEETFAFSDAMSALMVFAGTARG